MRGGALGAAIALIAAAPALAADFSWSGGATASTSAWSAGGNWAGGLAPSGPVGVLRFPALPSSCTAICYHGGNDITGLAASAISIDDFSPYLISGNALTLGSGGLSASTSAVSGQFPTWVAPLTLGASQTWTIGPGGTGIGQLTVSGDVTGSTAALAITLSHSSVLSLQGQDEVGSVTITGANSTLTGNAASQNGSVSLGAPFAPTAASLNGTDAHPVSVTDAGLLASNGTSGPLTATGANLQIGEGISPAGRMAVTGSVNLDSTSFTSFAIGGPGTVAGTDYSQLIASGTVNLGGVATIGAGQPGHCLSPISGTTYTLVRTTGSVTGTFAGAPDGGTISIGSPSGCPATGLDARINYTPTTVTATVVTRTGVPTVSNPPAIIGTARQGQTLAEVHGTWTGSPTSYVYAWEDCDASGGACQQIPQANAQTYTLTALDVGHTIRVLEFAKNANGTSAPSPSPATAVVGASAPVDNTPPTLSGGAMVGQTLTAQHGSWTGSPTSYDDLWEHCDAAGGGCQSIPGARGLTYVVAGSDVGSTIRLKETAHNSAGPSVMSASSVPTAIVTTGFVWTGHGTSSNWSDGGNWEGIAPGGSVASLSFPQAASGPAHNDISGLTVGSLTLNGNVVPDGNGITLGGGGLSVSGGFRDLALPVTLGADQSWSISSARVGLGGVVSGNHALTVRFAGSAAITVDQPIDVGPLTFAGADTALQNFSASNNGTVFLHAGANTSSAAPVTVSNVWLAGPGTVGPLAVHGGYLIHGVTVAGSAALDSTSAVNVTAGAANGGLVATGKVDLGGAQLLVDEPCGGVPPGTVSTLASSAGALTGTFAGVPDGVLIDASTEAACAPPHPQQLVIHYTANAVTASAAGPPTVVTGQPSAVSGAGATLAGTVTPNGLGVSDCHFEVGTTSVYGQTVMCAPAPGSGFAPVIVSSDIAGLLPQTTYHYRLVATNSAGTGLGQDQTFTTGPASGAGGGAGSGGGPPAAGCSHNSVAFGGIFTAYASCFESHGSDEVASGRVRLNGLDLVPDGSGTISIAPGALTISSSGPVSVMLGSTTVYHGDLHLDLGHTITLKVPGGVKIAGLSLTGTLDLTPKPDAMEVKAEASIGVPHFVSISGEIALQLTNADGLQLDSLKLETKDLPLGPITIKHASLSYKHGSAGDQWTGAAEVDFPPPWPSIEGTLGLLNGKVDEVGLAFGNLNVPIGEVVFLQKLGFDMKTQPSFTFTGQLGLSAGPTLPVFDGPAVEVDTNFSVEVGPPLKFTIDGTLKLVGKIDLAKAHIVWVVPTSSPSAPTSIFPKARHRPRRTSPAAWCRAGSASRATPASPCPASPDLASSTPPRRG